MVKIAINGFGRIGKQFFLACLEHNVNWDFVINENGDMKYIIYALQYDTVHPMPKNVKIKYDDKFLYYGKRKIRIYSEMDPEKLPWLDEKVDLVVECTGAFTEREGAMKHIKAGAKKVLISAPAKNHDVTIIYKVNDKVLTKDHTIVSAGSCTTNCVAPMIKILHDAFGVKNANFITTHAYTATQRLIDAADKKDFRRGRAAGMNIAPSTSGASQSVVESIPELHGKIAGYALRVPVVDGSIASVIATVLKETSVEEVNEIFKEHALKDMKEILDYTEEQIVSSDIIHHPASCIIDGGMTSVVDDTVSIAGWYDNEWGYSNRLVDVTNLLLKSTKFRLFG